MWMALDYGTVNAASPDAHVHPERADLRHARATTRRGTLSGCPQFVLVNHPALHHERDAFEFRDVAQRIAADRDDIGELAGRDRADAIAPAHDLGRRSRRRHDRGDRLLAEADAIGELA